VKRGGDLDLAAERGQQPAECLVLRYEQPGIGPPPPGTGKIARRRRPPDEYPAQRRPHGGDAVMRPRPPGLLAGNHEVTSAERPIQACENITAGPTPPGPRVLPRALERG